MLARWKNQSPPDNVCLLTVTGAANDHGSFDPGVKLIVVLDQRLKRRNSHDAAVIGLKGGAGRRVHPATDFAPLNTRLPWHSSTSTTPSLSFRNLTSKLRVRLGDDR